MIIFRAGLTGCLAAAINPDATVLDTGSEPVLHKAVLRFRSDAISKATGIPFQKIKVSKAVFDTDDWTFSDWTPRLANGYSQKVIDGIHNRSIESLEPVTRWLAPENFHEQLIQLIGDRIMWNESFTPMTKGPKISTLPMPDMLNLIGEDNEVLTVNFNSIFVTTLAVDISCDVHQTVYFPVSGNPIYRMTLEGQKLIIESRYVIEETDFCDLVCEVFALTDWHIVEQNYRQKIGKIAPVTDVLRKDIIFNLTEQYDIYSLGRTAIWKNILLDDCLQDINRIMSMISKSKYERMLG